MSAWRDEPWDLRCHPAWGDGKCADYKRAVLSVNALAGIQDPAAELSRLRACEAALKNIITNAIQRDDIYEWTKLMLK